MIEAITGLISKSYPDVVLGYRVSLFQLKQSVRRRTTGIALSI